MICDACNTEYEDDERTCPSCGTPSPAHSEDLSDDDMPPGLSPLEKIEVDDEIEEEPAEAVYRAPDEMTAAIVKGILEAEQIPVTVASRQVPWMDGVMTLGVGFYGELLVPASEADRARRIIEVFESRAHREE